MQCGARVMLTTLYYDLILKLTKIMSFEDCIAMSKVNKHFWILFENDETIRNMVISKRFQWWKTEESRFPTLQNMWFPFYKLGNTFHTLSWLHKNRRCYICGFRSNLILYAIFDVLWCTSCGWSQLMSKSRVSQFLKSLRLSRSEEQTIMCQVHWRRLDIANCNGYYSLHKEILDVLPKELHGEYHQMIVHS